MNETISTHLTFHEARRIASNNMQEAMVAEFRGHAQEALRFYEIAFEAEEQAALLCSEKEWMRFIIFRSAAALAMNCKRYEDSKRWIALGLAINPPENIRNQIMDIAIAVERASVPQEYNAKNHIILTGLFTVADANSRKITIESERQGIVKVRVPRKMDEIVQNYWGIYVNA